MTSKQILIIAIATLITVVLWVIFDVLHSRAQVRPAPQVEKIIEPVSPDFDQSAINQL